MKRLSALLIALFAMMGFTFANAGTASASGTPLYNGRYLVHSCATPKGNSTANGTIITTWGCTGSSLQQWELRNNHIYHVASGKCLTPQGNASATNGAILTLWTCDWNNSVQDFIVSGSPTEQDRIWTSWGGKCITNDGGSMADGVYLTLWTCASGDVPEQTWSI